MPDSGYRFLVWSDGVQSARRVDAGVSADLSVVAEFAPVGVGADRWTDIGDQECGGCVWRDRLSSGHGGRWAE